MVLNNPYLTVLSFHRRMIVKKNNLKSLVEIQFIATILIRNVPRKWSQNLALKQASFKSWLVYELIKP